MKLYKQIVIGIFTILFSLLFTTICIATTSAIVNTDTLKLRKEGSTESTVLELLNNGQKLEVIEQSGDWYKVKVNNITGFVHKDYIKIQEEVVQEKPEEKVEEKKEELVETNTQVEEQTVQEQENKEPVTENKEFEIREDTLKNDSDVYILPLINSNKIGKLKKNSKVTIMDETNGWYYVQNEELNAWVRKEAFNEKENKTDDVTTNNTNTNQEDKIEEKQIEKKVLYVNSPSIYVRKGPNTTFEVADTLVLNAQVTVIAESGDWYKVEVNGITGYIAKRLLSEQKQETTSRSAEERIEEQSQETEEKQTTNVTTSSKGDEIAAFAKKYLGCKYVYGGSGPNTFDCSGFTMYVFKNFGISLSHSATAQSKNGTYVAKTDLKPGDLVFFKDYETMNGIGHVGIYIGNGDFIHASSGTGYCVKTSTLLSGSYDKRYETARRLF